MGLRYRLLRVVPFRGSGGILPWKAFKIKVLGNGISGSLRPSQGVILSQFLFKGV